MARMQMSFNLTPRLEMRLKMAPQIIQSIEILQLPLLALQERIEQEQLENPTLEIEEELEDEDRVRELTKAEEAEVSDEFDKKVDTVADDFHDYFTQAGSTRSYRNSDKDEKLEAIQNTPGRQGSLRDHLLDQLKFQEMDERQRDVCEGIINNLNRDGRLSFPLEEIVASLDDPPTMEAAQAALRVVQSLDPSGVGARDLRECLLLQLDREDPDYHLQRQLILNHLRDIEANRFPKIVRDTGRDLEEVKAAVAAVCLLHPAPGRLYDNEVVPTVVPDLYVEMIDGRYEVRLDDTHLPRLRISPVYHQMLQTEKSGTDTRKYLNKKMESARWLIDSILQRRRTILKVGREMVKAQKEFFDHGLSHLRPLKMQEVADVVGMHVATVSRAIKLKYMQTPRGLYPMKFFFSGGTRSSEGEMEAWSAVKARIKRLVDEEDKTSPLSDDEIMKQLAEQGVKIARRTVTKYRKVLEIPSSRHRKQY